MCIAAPMRIIEIDAENGKARAELNGNEFEINIGLVSPRVGDYALVHAGCALEIIREQAAEEIFGLLNELEEAFKDEY